MNKRLRSEARKRLKKFIQKDSEQTPAPVFLGFGNDQRPRGVSEPLRHASSSVFTSVASSLAERMSSSTSAISSSCSKVASNSTLKPSSASRMRVAPSSFWSARNCESVFVSHHGYFLPVLKPSPTTRERRD